MTRRTPVLARRPEQPVDAVDARRGQPRFRAMQHRGSARRATAARRRTTTPLASSAEGSPTAAARAGDRHVPSKRVQSRRRYVGGGGSCLAHGMQNWPSSTAAGGRHCDHRYAVEELGARRSSSRRDQLRVLPVPISASTSPRMNDAARALDEVMKHRVGLPPARRRPRRSRRARVHQRLRRARQSCG